MTAASDVVGRSPEQLSLPERAALAGLTVGLELYSPQSLPERLIVVIGDSAADCMRQLAAKGLDARKYEFVVLKAQ